MRYLRLSVFTILFIISAGLIYASPASEADRAVAVFATNETAALGILNEVYRQSPANFFTIKTRLLNLQSYRLYRNFLTGLPRTKDHVTELVLIKILMSDTNGLVVELTNAAALGATMEYFSKNYSVAVCEPAVSGYFAKYLNLPPVFELLSKSFTTQNRIEEFDAMLRQTPVNRQPDSASVLKYITDSWMKRQRPLGWLVGRYEFAASPLIDGILLYSKYASGDYAGVVADYRANPARYPTALMTSSNIDINYIYGYSLFRTGEYKASMDYVAKTAYPWDNDVGRMLFLNNLGLGDLAAAKAQLNAVRNEDAKRFYDAFLDLLNNKTNQGMVKLERYLYIIETERQYPLESLLLVYTFYNQPAALTDVIEIVRKSLLYQYDFEPVGNVGLSAVYTGTVTGNVNLANAPSGYAGDYSKYAAALGALREGDVQRAKTLFTQLATAENVSPLVKSLALYQLRKIS